MSLFYWVQEGVDLDGNSEEFLADSDLTELLSGVTVSPNLGRFTRCDPMFVSLLLLGVVVLLLFIAALPVFLSKRRGQISDSAGNELARYEAIPALLTPAERSFYGVLRQVMSPDYEIFSKVRLADTVRPLKNPNRSVWQTAFNRISSKHVDFVLCDPANLKILAVIELDDRSHASIERGSRDSFVNSIFEQVNIPILRVPAKGAYLPKQLREEIEKMIGSK